MKKSAFLTFLGLLVLLIGCNPPDQKLSIAMEESIAKQYTEVSDFQLQQQVPWQDGGVALVTFDAVNNRDMAFKDCYGIGYFRNNAAITSVFTAMSSCGNAVQAKGSGDNPSALETIPYGSLALVQQDTAVAFGQVNHLEGAQVRIDWDDGENETVDVVNSSYLAPRSGLSEVEEVTLLDKDGNLLATVTP